MFKFRHTVLTIALAALSCSVFSQTAAEHKQHHATEAANKATKAYAATSAAMPKDAMVAMDDKMTVMREMREKMRTAKTPQERKALMSDHLKLMQEGMFMMDKMGSMGDMKGMGSKSPDTNKGHMPMDMMEHHAMMNKRMEMMTTMMQMMMDQLPAPAAQ